MTPDPLIKYPREAYGPLAPRVVNVKRTYPSERGWGPGWPDCQPGKLETARSVRPSDGKTFNRPVRKEVVALFSFLMQATMDLGYEFRTNAEPGGGVSTYVCRAIKGTTTAPSWHSWGLAIDINSAANPMLLSGSVSWRSTQPPWMVDLWESSGFYWGGRYNKMGTVGYADAMHFEYCFRPGDVTLDLANARAAFARIKAQLQPEDETLKAFAVPTVPMLALIPTGVRLYLDSAFTTAQVLIDPGRDMPYLGEPVAGAALIGYANEQGVPSGMAYFAKVAELQNIRPAPVDDFSDELAAANQRITSKDAAFDTVMINAQTGRAL